MAQTRRVIARGIDACGDGARAKEECTPKLMTVEVIMYVVAGNRAKGKALKNHSQREVDLGILVQLRLGSDPAKRFTFIWR